MDKFPNLEKMKKVKEKPVHNPKVTTFCLETGSVDIDFRDTGLEENYDLIDDLMDVLLKYESQGEEASV